MTMLRRYSEAIRFAIRARLITGKLAFASDSLVRFRGTLDSILELAAALGQLLGYYVNTRSCITELAVGCKRNPVANSKLGVRH